jgi:hypothetical protein
MASREKVDGMRASARGRGSGTGEDEKRAAAHQKYVQDRYEEYIDRGGMESDEAWAAAVTDAKRFYPKYYSKDPNQGVITPEQMAAVAYANPYSQEVVASSLDNGTNRLAEAGEPGRLPNIAGKAPAAAVTPAPVTPTPAPAPAQAPDAPPPDAAPQAASTEGQKTQDMPTPEQYMAAKPYEVDGETGYVVGNVFYTDAEWKQVSSNLASRFKGF